MSTSTTPILSESLRRFAAAAQVDGPLRRALQAQHAQLGVEGLVAIAAEHGIPLEASEIRTVVASLDPGRELSDEALDQVQGGGLAIMLLHLMGFPFTGTSQGGWG